MMKIDKIIIARVVLAAWTALWLLFLIRPYFKKDIIGEYGALLSRDLEGKRSYVTGDDLYAFIMDCRDSIPAGTFTYSLIGLDDDQLGQCRINYYLYPATSGADAEYVFVYKKPGCRPDGYSTFRKFGEDKYMLRKAK